MAPPLPTVGVHTNAAVEEGTMPKPMLAIVTHWDSTLYRVPPGPRKSWKMFSFVWNILLHIIWITSATVNFCNIPIQLITYLRLDGRIATAILERSLKSP